MKNNLKLSDLVDIMEGVVLALFFIVITGLVVVGLAALVVLLL